MIEHHRIEPLGCEITTRSTTWRMHVDGFVEAIIQTRPTCHEPEVCFAAVPIAASRAFTVVSTGEV
jgi:hypothetical protein